MIIVSLNCQMGNQLFQYAFAKATARRLGAFLIPFQSNPFYPFKLQFFELDLFTRFVYSHPKVTKQYHRICRKLVKHVFKTEITGNDWQNGVEIRNNVYYEGFFQSDSYFQKYDSLIKKRLTLRKQYRKAFENKYKELFDNNKVIVVHFRRKDYLDVEFDGLGGKGVALPFEYYRKALDSIEGIENYKVLFIGDDVESVKNEFGHEYNHSFESNSAIVDFQLIQHADIAIIANSTFAWWAAYLSQKPDAKIIAPEYWLGYKVKKEYPVGIRTDKFEWLEF